MLRTLFIHAGPPKTGSTVIQQFCRDNAAGLARHGVYWPRTGTERLNAHHANLVDAFSRPPGASPLLKKLKSELADANWPERVLISSEHFAPRIADADYFKTLEIHCQSLGYFPHLIAYIRPQPALINSHYTQFVKNWRPVPPLAAFISKALAMVRFDYPKMFAPILASPTARLTLRPYSQQTLSVGLLRDFLAVLDIPWPAAADFTDAGTANVSPGAKTIAAFIDIRARAANELPSFKRSGLRAFTRPILLAAGNLGWNAEKFRGIDAAAHAHIRSLFAASNERIAQAAWGCSWHEAFGDVDVLPRPINIFIPEQADAESLREFADFTSQAVQAICDSALQGAVPETDDD